ncbi:MAG: AEC family transporter, partial [Spirochaetales bacterium]|nr:AEC family transporter [Spirochaetales bacterium]
MEVIKISAIAIAPIMFFMALGYFFQRRSILSRPAAKELNIIVFRFFLSTMCAETLYKADLKRDVELMPILVVAFSLVGTFLILCLIIPRFIKEKDQIPVMIQGIYKSNYALLGIPIAQSLCGADRIGITAVVAIVILPLNNIFSAFIFERYTGKATILPKLLLKIVTNPLVLASLIGLGLNLCGIRIPNWIMTGIIAKLSSLATPLSMIALGATFEFGFLRKYGKKIFWAVFTKLIIIP